MFCLQKESWNTTPPPIVFEEIMSMTDYELLNQASIDDAREKIKGITQVSMIKMTLAENGRDVHMIYKEDSDKKGWLPRPVLPQRTSAWKNTSKITKQLLRHRKLWEIHNPLRYLISLCNPGLKMHFFV